MARDFIKEAEEELHRAEETVRVQKRRLAAMEDPIVRLACQLHAVFCKSWCDSEVCFEPYRPPLIGERTGWNVVGERVYNRYIAAAQRIYSATADLPADKVRQIVQAVVDAKAAGDAERSRSW